jgi:alpha-methylacyl-CoA racemase
MRIASVALNVPGPVAAALLRDIGARVTKIEPPEGDPLAAMSPAWYRDLVRGIDVRTLDLKTDSGRARMDDILAETNVLMTSSRPASLARLGLGREDMEDRHPHLCYVAIVGYPEPRTQVAGHDLTYQAQEGLLAPPEMPRTVVSDLAGAQQAVIATLALLLGQARGESARYAEVSLSESARLFAAPIRHGLTATGGHLAGGFAGYGVYETREGWIAIAALEPRFRAGLQRELGVSPDDRVGLTRVFKTRTADEWERWAEQVDLPIVTVR